MPAWGSEIWSIALLAMMLILSADKFLSALERMGKVPERLQRWDHRRANEIAARARRDAALNTLADKADTILDRLLPNGGTSVTDRIEALHTRLDESDGRSQRMAENLQAHVFDSAADSALLRETANNLAVHITDTAPLIQDFITLRDRMAQSEPSDPPA